MLWQAVQVSEAEVWTEQESPREIMTAACEKSRVAWEVLEMARMETADSDMPHTDSESESSMEYAEYVAADQECREAKAAFCAESPEDCAES